MGKKKRMELIELVDELIEMGLTIEERMSVYYSTFNELTVENGADRFIMTMELLNYHSTKIFEIGGIITK